MTEHKFKVGDTVRCPSAGVRGAGDFIGRVESLQPDRVYRLTDYPLGIHEDHLELVEDADGWMRGRAPLARAEDPATAPKLRLTPEQPICIDPASIKPGDRVAVWCEVSKTGGGRLLVVTHKPDSSGLGDTTFTVWDNALIALHEPKPEEPIKVGDRVCNKHCAAFPKDYPGGEVLGVWKDRAWVLWPKMLEPGIVELDHLRRWP